MSFVTFSSSFSKKDNKYDISVLIISFVTFCALSTLCWVIFAVNFTGWFIVTIIGGAIARFRQEIFKSSSGKKTKVENNMLDHRLNSSRHIGHFEDFRISSSKDSLPSIPSCRSSVKSNKTSNKINSILSFDFSFPGLNGNNKLNKSKTVLPPSESSLKRNEKRMKKRHVPDIPSQLGPNRQKEEWKSNVDYFPSERHSHQPKSKLSVTEKMIESTAAYRVGKKCSGWINGDAEEYVIKNQQKDSTTDCTSSVSYDDPFYSRKPIKDLNVRLDQERPKITRQERKTYNKSPASSLQYARQYLTILLTVKKEMNL